MAYAIKVDGVSKEYDIGAQRRTDGLLVDHFGDALRHPLRTLRRAFARGDGQRFWALRDLAFEIEQGDEVFHVLYDLDQKIQIPGIAALFRGVTYERDGYVPHWRGIYDDDGRLMVAINFNMDLGDAWEHADDPRYPEPMTTLAYRFAVNYVMYAMTH